MALSCGFSQQELPRHVGVNVFSSQRILNPDTLQMLLVPVKLSEK